MGALWFWGWALSLRSHNSAMEPGAGPPALRRGPRRLLLQDVAVTGPKGVRMHVGVCVEESRGRGRPGRSPVTTLWPLPMLFPYMAPMPCLCSQTGLGSIPTVTQ